MIIRIFLEAAPRRSELVLLQKTNLCFITSHWLKIPAVKTKARQCKLTQSLFNDLKSINTEVLFPRFWNNPNKLGKYLQNKLKQYSLPRITCHQFRYCKWNAYWRNSFVCNIKVYWTLVYKDDREICDWKNGVWYFLYY